MPGTVNRFVVLVTVTAAVVLATVTAAVVLVPALAVGTPGGPQLPDLDQEGTTISRMWGPISDLPAKLINAVSGGHRWGRPCLGYNACVRPDPQAAAALADIQVRARQLEPSLLRVPEHAMHANLAKVTSDELLEMYSAWRSEPTVEHVEDLERIVGEIRQINPSFRFELPKSS